MNKRYQVLLFLVATVTWQLGFCETQTLTVSEGKRLEASIAQDSMNRLMVSNDRILNIFGDEGSFVTQSDEQTGQVFIKPTVENGLKPLSLTLITENGLTQDLTLHPSQMTAATIVLKHSDRNQVSPAQDALHSFVPVNQVSEAVPLSLQWVTLLKQAVLGELTPISQTSSSRRLASGCKARFLKAYQAEGYVVRVWSVKKQNQAFRPQEQNFYQPQDLAICLQAQSLNQGGDLLLYVLSKR